MSRQRTYRVVPRPLKPLVPVISGHCPSAERRQHSENGCIRYRSGGSGTETELHCIFDVWKAPFATDRTSVTTVVRLCRLRPHTSPCTSDGFCSPPAHLRLWMVRAWNQKTQRHLGLRRRCGGPGKRGISRGRDIRLFANTPGPSRRFTETLMTKTHDTKPKLSVLQQTLSRNCGPVRERR